MPFVFANNGFSFLTSDVTSLSQDITIRSADAGLFPQPDQAKGEVFMITMEDRSTNKIEICECFRRVGATLSLRRAREGTTSESFLAGASVSNRLTAGVIAGGLQGWAEFNRRYLGAYATQPSLDPLGFPLQRGAIIYDLNTDALFVYTSDGWTKWSPSGDLQTGIPPGGVPGDTLTRNALGDIEWRPTVDLAARDAASVARDAAAAAQTTATAAQTSASTKVSRGGDTMTGPLSLAPGADAAGNASGVLTLASRGTGRGMIRHSRGGLPFADMYFASDGALRYARFSPTGTLIDNKNILLDGDALPSVGGTLSGPVLFEAAANIVANGYAAFNGGASIRNLVLTSQGNATDGGEMVFLPQPGGLGLHQDVAINFFRMFRSTDQAMLATLNLSSGEFNVNNKLAANEVVSRNDISARSAVYANYFRMAADVDTGLDGSGDGYATLINNGQPTLQTQPGGNVYVWGNVTAFSDERLKENIEPLEHALAIVDAMQGVRFTRKGDDTQRQHIGFIAQHVEHYAPELIERSADGMLGVNYMVYVSVLNEAIKHLHTRVRSLEALKHA